jgi:hypothetical protein
MPFERSRMVRIPGVEVAGHPATVRLLLRRVGALRTMRRATRMRRLGRTRRIIGRRRTMTLRRMRGRGAIRRALG